MTETINNGENCAQIYSLSNCSHCKAAKRFLSDCSVEYTFVDVDCLKGDERKAIVSDIKKLTPDVPSPPL